jgi:hypothetical protein
LFGYLKTVAIVRSRENWPPGTKDGFWPIAAINPPTLPYVPMPRGIDCPEKGQAFGNKAKQAASALVFGKEITLQTYGHDKYGRTLADVILPDGTNVNHTRSKTAGAGGIGNTLPGIEN